MSEFLCCQLFLKISHSASWLFLLLCGRKNKSPSCLRCLCLNFWDLWMLLHIIRDFGNEIKSQLLRAKISLDFLERPNVITNRLIILSQKKSVSVVNIRCVRVSCGNDVRKDCEVSSRSGTCLLEAEKDKKRDFTFSEGSLVILWLQPSETDFKYHLHNSKIIYFHCSLLLNLWYTQKEINIPYL
jgi:hypothetical protein